MEDKRRWYVQEPLHFVLLVSDLYLSFSHDLSRYRLLLQPMSTIGIWVLKQPS